MAGVNRVFLVGNLGRDPELRHTNGGAAVVNFSVATGETWTDKNGDRQEQTEWHEVVVWNKPAEACAQFLYKGSMVCVEGKITTEDWTDKEGNKRKSTKIVANKVTFLGGVGDKKAVSDGADVNTGPGEQSSLAGDIPF